MKLPPLLLPLVLSCTGLLPAADNPPGPADPSTNNIPASPARPYPPRFPGASAPTPTPEPDPPGQVTWTSPMQNRPHFPGRMSPESEGHGSYLSFRKVVVNRHVGSVDFDVTLGGPLPESFPKDQGAYFVFGFQFDVATKGHPHELFQAPIKIGYAQKAKKFEWSGGKMNIGNRNMDLKVTNFTRTGAGFTVTVTSHALAEDFPAGLQISSSSQSISSPGNPQLNPEALGLPVIKIPPLSSLTSPNDRNSLLK